MKLITHAPLPFAGQKRNWRKPLTDILNQVPENITIVDVFGGSGLCSRICKDLKPFAKVIYNDYDNYSERIAHIKETEELRQKLLKIATERSPRGKRIQDKEAIIRVVKVHIAKYGYIDWITLSVYLLFSNNFCSSIEELEESRLYNSVSRTPINEIKVSEYLKGLEVVHFDFRDLIKMYINKPNILFLIDPPYLATNTAGYKGKFWYMKDYIDLLDLLPQKGYIYFSSTKLDFVPLLQRMGTKQTFERCTSFARKSQCGGGEYNTEIMYYKL